ncbi:MAG: hypothetical protein ACKV22_22570 [Bryobacteraceae bacterium]
MLTQVLVATGLVEKGGRLVDWLVQNKFPMMAAFWGEFDDDDWRLMIMSAEIDTLGPRALYDLLIPLLHQFNAEEKSPFPNDSVSLVSPRSSLYERVLGFAAAQRQHQSGNTGEASVHNVSLGDLYIYRA